MRKLTPHMGRNTGKTEPFSRHPHRDMIRTDQKRFHGFHLGMEWFIWIPVEIQDLLNRQAALAFRILIDRGDGEQRYIAEPGDGDFFRERYSHSPHYGIQQLGTVVGIGADETGFGIFFPDPHNAFPGIGQRIQHAVESPVDQMLESGIFQRR